MSAPLLILGSDHRLESEIETMRDESLHFQAPSDGGRFALYGPYVDLAPGRYRIELRFSLQNEALTKPKVELSANKAKKTIYGRECFPWELQAGLIRISYPFRDGVKGLEVRFNVPAGVGGSIQSLSISANGPA